MNCPSCGSPISPGTGPYCGNCGAPAGAGASAPTTPMPPSPSSYAPATGAAPPPPFDLIGGFLRPFRTDPDAPKKVGIGALLLLIPLLGALLVAGYGLRFLKQLLHQRSAILPEWDEWAGMLLEGLYKLVVGFVFGVIPLAVGGVLCVPAVAHGISRGNVGEIVSTILIGMLVTALLLFIFGIPIPMALCRYADTNSLGEAFNVREIMRLVTANLGQYLLIMVMSVVLGFAWMVASNILHIVPILGTIAAIAAMLVGGVVFTLAIHSAFSEYYLRYR